MIGTSRRCAALGVLVLMICAAVTVIDIMTRRTMSWSLPGLIDLSQLLVMTSVFLCIPYAFARRANVEVNLVHERLPPVIRRAVTIFTALASAAFLAVVVWRALDAGAQAWSYGEQSPTLALPMALYWMPIVLGSGLAALVCLVQGFRHDDPVTSIAIDRPGRRTD